MALVLPMALVTLGEEGVGRRLGARGVQYRRLRIPIRPNRHRQTPLSLPKQHTPPLIVTAGRGTGGEG